MADTRSRLLSQPRTSRTITRAAARGKCAIYPSLLDLEDSPALDLQAMTGRVAAAYLPSPQRINISSRQTLHGILL